MCGAGRQVAACFTPRVVELFLAEKDVTVEVRGGLLAACRIGKRARAVSYSADAHYRRTGQWPWVMSGPVADALGKTWAAVEAALELGCLEPVGGPTSLDWSNIGLMSSVITLKTPGRAFFRATLDKFPVLEFLDPSEALDTPLLTIA